MKNRKIWLFISLIVTLLVIILLITGSKVLTISLDENDTIPLGTFITWIGLISLPLAVLLSIKELRIPTRTFNSILSRLLKTILILAILWVPISYLLAGNISFTFGEKTSFQGGQIAMKWFWRLCYTIAVGPILILVMYWFSVLFMKKK